MWDQILVYIIVLVCAVYTGKLLLPNTAKISLAKHTQGILPDRIRIWLVGKNNCGSCKN